MKKKFFSALLVLLIVFTLLAGIFIHIAASEKQSVPKNVIILIGDGMGQNQVNMAHENIRTNLNMENMPYRGTSQTANVVGQITDSAAGGTALACGIKTGNGFIGMDININTVENIREFLVARGRKSGIVSTVNITDATPAAFGAHNINRANQSLIAAEYIRNEIDIIMGGGASNFYEDVIDNAKNIKGYTVINKKSEFLSFDGNSKLLALFSDGNFPYYAKGYPEDIPSIEQMTTKSIDILSSHPDGFFLMVEGGRIDHAGHDNSLSNQLTETLEFDKAVKAAMDFAERDGNTLVIVTADHETGGLTKNGTKYVFTSKNHSMDDVFVFATGTGAQNFSGEMINTDICNKLKTMYIEYEKENGIVITTTQTTKTEKATSSAKETTETASSTLEVTTTIPPADTASQNETTKRRNCKSTYDVNGVIIILFFLSVTVFTARKKMNIRKNF